MIWLCSGTLFPVRLFRLGKGYERIHEVDGRCTAQLVISISISSL
jgi:hypothetical protein